MPRQTPLNEDLIATIEQALARGNTQKDVADALGFRPETLTRWKQRGLDEMEIHPKAADYTMAQLRQLAMDQGVDLNDIEGRITKAAIARHVYIPTIYTQYAQATTRARSRGIDNAIEGMLRAGRDDWRMWAHYLAMRDPDNWSKARIEDRLSGDAERARDEGHAADLLGQGATVEVAVLEVERKRRRR